MCSGQSEVFAELSEDLASELLTTAKRFYRSRGLKAEPDTSLRQMSTSLDSVSRELLMFGADYWPISVAEDAIRAPAVHLAPPSLLERFALWLVLALGTLSAGHLLVGIVPPHSLSALFLLSVAICSIKLGRMAALGLAVFAVAACNFFFVPPILQFSAMSHGDMLIGAVGLIMAILLPALPRGFEGLRDLAKPLFGGLASSR